MANVCGYAWPPSERGFNSSSGRILFHGRGRGGQVDRNQRERESHLRPIWRKGHWEPVSQCANLNLKSFLPGQMSAQVWTVCGTRANPFWLLRRCLHVLLRSKSRGETTEAGGGRSLTAPFTYILSETLQMGIALYSCLSPYHPSPRLIPDPNPWIIHTPHGCPGDLFLLFQPVFHPVVAVLPLCFVLRASHFFISQLFFHF